MQVSGHTCCAYGYKIDGSESVSFLIVLGGRCYQVHKIAMPFVLLHDMTCET